MYKEEKKLIRQQIKAKKAATSPSERTEWSDVIMNSIEIHPLFQRAKTILLYHSLPDEVQTHEFIEKWRKNKHIVLPSVQGDRLILKTYSGKGCMKKGCFNIEEPTGEAFTTYDDIDLAIIPGVSFDKRGNRLGRGKGYYDKLLPLQKAYKIGICFQFQLTDKLPTDVFDSPVNEVWSENGLFALH